MNFTVSIDKKKLYPFEPIKIHILVENNTDTAISLPTEFKYVAYFNNDFGSSQYEIRAIKKQLSNVTIEPRKKVSCSFDQPIELLFLPKTAEMEHFDFKFKLDIYKNFPERVDYQILHEECLIVDFTDFQNLNSELNTSSHYFISNKTIFYTRAYSRLFERAIKVLKGAPKDYRILDTHYAINAQSVYKDGTLLRGITSKDFKVLNHLFAGNKECILTRYGKAKVESPPTFVVLDDGRMAGMFTSEINGFNCGYARDDRFAYFFCESTSTEHATKVRACKNPHSFLSLGYGYGKDDRNVYLEGVKLPKAKPSTFVLLNRSYSTDGIHLYHYRDIMEGVDIPSFKILPTTFWEDDPDILLNSDWAKDKNHYFYIGSIATKQEYIETENNLIQKDLFYALKMHSHVWGYAFELDITGNEISSKEQRTSLIDRACEIENIRLSKDNFNDIRSLNLLGNNWIEIAYEDASELLLNAIRFDLAYLNSERTPLEKAQYFHQQLIQKFVKNECFIYTNHYSSPWVGNGSSGYLLTEDVICDLGIVMINKSTLTFVYFLGVD